MTGNTEWLSDQYTQTHKIGGGEGVYTILSVIDSISKTSHLWIIYGFQQKTK